jgi:hypothetical protein
MTNPKPFQIINSSSVSFFSVLFEAALCYEQDLSIFLFHLLSLSFYIPPIVAVIAGGSTSAPLAREMQTRNRFASGSGKIKLFSSQPKNIKDQQKKNQRLHGKRKKNEGILEIF